MAGDINRIAQEALLDAVAAPAFFVDRDYRYLAFNEANRRAVLRMYSIEIQVGGSLLEAVSNPEDRDRLQTNLDRALSGETLSDGQWYGDQMGDRFFYTITYAPVARKGMLIGVAAVAVDATDLMDTQEALRMSDQKFRAAFLASPDAININRLSDGLFIDVNQGFTQLTGYTPEDVAGKTSLEIAVWANEADRERLVAELRSAGHVDRLEADFRRKDGSLTTAEMSASIIDFEGHPCILSVTRDISDRKRAEDALEASNERLQQMGHDVVETLGRVVEARDPYTQGHEKRTADLCRQIANEMGYGEGKMDALETAALLHDIGKMTIPAEILTKPGTLTPVEWALIREHPQASYEILKDIAFDWPVAELVLQHHERMDGSGYPRGLHTDQIDVAARILAVADVVEAMISHRPYRAALGLQAAAEELRSHPQKYDAAVVKAFLALCDGGCLVM
jgi:PAS domain S-box-containing protein/putative nucleotidyltransferase with HDIG domain